MRRIFILLLAITLCTYFNPHSLNALDLEDTIPYKLSIINTQNGYPQDTILDRTIKPSRAIITEFQWILDTLKHRCGNSEESIANTIVETWYIVKNWDHIEMSLLEVARVLIVVARNKVLLGHGRVNFRATSNYWLSQNKPGKMN